jgi:hypothetical protein
MYHLIETLAATGKQHLYSKYFIFRVAYCHVLTSNGRKQINHAWTFLGTCLLAIAFSFFSLSHA